MVFNFTRFVIPHHFVCVGICLLIFGRPEISVNHHLCVDLNPVYVCYGIVHLDLHAILLSELFSIYGKIQMEYVITFSYLCRQRFAQNAQYKQKLSWWAHTKYAFRQFSHRSSKLNAVKMQSRNRITC